jgi:hypothetical protein
MRAAKLWQLYPDCHVNGAGTTVSSAAVKTTPLPNNRQNYGCRVGISTHLGDAPLLNNQQSYAKAAQQTYDRLDAPLPNNRQSYGSSPAKRWGISRARLV